MKIRLKPVKAYELLAADGRVVARLTMASSWEGMAKLQTEEGKTLIIESPDTLGQSMAETLSIIMGTSDGTVECSVIKVSPSLAAELTGTPGGAE